MQTLFIVTLVAFTSLLALGAGRRWLGLSFADAGRAAARTLEIAETAVLFLALNLGVGLAVILAVRAFTPAFVAVYVLDDTSVLVMSALQGVAFHAWKTSRQIR
jgi:hypothetical protein